MHDTDSLVASRPPLIDVSEAEQASAHARRAHLRDTASRCSVLDAYLYLVDALGPVTRTDHIDLVMANEVDDDLALLALGWRGCYLVRPSDGDRAPVATRAHVSRSWQLEELDEVAVIRDGRGRRLRIVAGDEVQDLPLTRRAAEAASQVCFVANERIHERRPRHTWEHETSRVLAELTELAQRHREGALSVVEYERAKRRLLSA